MRKDLKDRFSMFFSKCFPLLIVIFFHLFGCVWFSLFFTYSVLHHEEVSESDKCESASNFSQSFSEDYLVLTEDELRMFAAFLSFEEQTHMPADLSESEREELKIKLLICFYNMSDVYNSVYSALEMSCLRWDSNLFDYVFSNPPIFEKNLNLVKDVFCESNFHGYDEYVGNINFFMYAEPGTPVPPYYYFSTVNF